MCPFGKRNFRLQHKRNQRIQTFVFMVVSLRFISLHSPHRQTHRTYSAPARLPARKSVLFGHPRFPSLAKEGDQLGTAARASRAVRVGGGLPAGLAGGSGASLAGPQARSASADFSSEPGDLSRGGPGRHTNSLCVHGQLRPSFPERPRALRGLIGSEGMPIVGWARGPKSPAGGG